MNLLLITQSEVIWTVLSLVIAMASLAKATPLEAWVEAEMKNRRLPGVAVGIYRYGKPVEIVTRGFADLERKVPVQRATSFEICSITKQFTAAGALVLVQDGKMRLDDPISQYVDGVPKSWSGVTIRRLLNHTSGVPERIFKSGLWMSTPKNIVKKLTAQKLSYPPGDRWSYNNTGYWLAGQAIEKASGMSYFAFLDKRIFKPLGMKNTHPNRESLKIPNKSKGYARSRKGYRPAMALTDRMGYAAGGLVSTVDDMNIWSEALRTNRLLSPEMRSEMLRPAILRSGHQAWNYPGPEYGLGVFLGSSNGHRIEKHSGGWNDASCQLARFPDDGLTVVLFTNVGGYEQRSFAGERIAKLFIPEIEVPQFKRSKDKKVAATNVVIKVLNGLASRRMPSALLSSSGRQAIDGNIGRLRAAVGTRPLESLAFLQHVPQGLTSVYLYEARFRHTIWAAVSLTSDLRVADLQVLEPPLP